MRKVVHWFPTKYPGYFVTKSGRVRGKLGQELKPVTCARYPVVTIYMPNYKFNVPLHILVLETFVGPKLNGKEGCHKNGNKLDARIYNLYWGTRAENIADSIRHGTHGKQKLREEDVLEIRSRGFIGTRQKPGNCKALALEFGISERHARYIVRLGSWKNV